MMLTETPVARKDDSNLDAMLDAAAARIRRLMKDWTANTLALGSELATAAKRFSNTPGKMGRPRLFDARFVKWAQQTTGLSNRQVEQLVAIHEKFGQAKRETLEHLPQRVMKMLVKGDVPENARREAIDRAEKGEQIDTSRAKEIIRAHKHPTPKAANQQAKEEGRPVLASDGYIYFGTDPARAKEGEDRRTMIYGVRRALDTLGSIHLTGRQFMAYALPHQLWSADEAKIIKRALHWLQSLDEAWDNRE